MVTQIDYPKAPAAERRRSTLLDVASVEPGINWLDGEGLFESYNALTFGAEANFCAPNAKDLDDQGSWQDGFRFAAYGGLTCNPVGMDIEGARAGVRESFSLGESTAVERALMKYRFVANASGGAVPGEWAAPVDLTPAGGAVSPVVGVALLEGYAASVYTGVPTLHLPITVGSLWLVEAGLEATGSLRTATGSKVVLGAGYDLPNTGPTGAAAPAGERWIYATGEVLVRQGPDMAVREAVDPVNNEVVMLAERPYIIAVDTFVAAVRVSV